MSLSDLKSKIDGKIAALQALLQRLRTFRESLDNDDLADVLADLEPDTKTAKVTLRRPKSAYFDKVVSHFVQNKNDWSRTGEIARSTGLTTHSVRQMIYARYPDFFENRVDPSDDKRKQFRLSKPDETIKAEDLI
jgi:hypothetical protein